MARFETGFQLAWAAGALVPVALRPPTWAGLLAIAWMLIAGSVVYIISARRSLRFEPEAMLTRLWVHRRLEAAEAPLEAVILLYAEEDAARGAHRLAVVEAASAGDVLMARFVRQPEGCGPDGLGRTVLAGSTTHDVSESPSPRTPSSSLLWPPLEWQELEQMRTRAACADHELTSDESDHAIALAGRLMELLRLDQR